MGLRPRVPPAIRPPAWWQRREPAWRLLTPILDLLARLLLRLRVAGLEHLPPTGPLVIAANHISHVDPIVLLVAAKRAGRRARFLAVSGLFHVPITRTMLRLERAIPVYRRAGPAAMALAAKSALDAGQCVVVYPEGTIVPAGDERDAQPGAGLLALTGAAPVLPAAQVGVEQGVRWWRPGHRAAVVFGPPVTVTGDPDDPVSCQRASEQLLEAVRELLPEARRLAGG